MYWIITYASTNPDIYGVLKKELQKYFADENIAELSSAMNSEKWNIKIGKCSYGPLCRNHPLIESIGAFSSFACGTEVVFDHPTQFISVHPMIYRGNGRDKTQA